MRTAAGTHSGEYPTARAPSTAPITAATRIPVVRCHTGSQRRMASAVRMPGQGAGQVRRGNPPEAPHRGALHAHQSGGGHVGSIWSQQVTPRTVLTRSFLSERVVTRVVGHAGGHGGHPPAAESFPGRHGCVAPEPRPGRRTRDRECDPSPQRRPRRRQAATSGNLRVTARSCVPPHRCRRWLSRCPAARSPRGRTGRERDFLDCVAMHVEQRLPPPGRLSARVQCRPHARRGPRPRPAALSACGRPGSARQSRPRKSASLLSLWRGRVGNCGSTPTVDYE